MEELALICQDSIEGILTGVYEAYNIKKQRQIPTHDKIHLLWEEPRIRNFYTEYQNCATEKVKAVKVADTIKRMCGKHFFYTISIALSTHDENKADAVYHAIVLALLTGDRNALERLADDYVRKVFQLSRFANNEILHLKEFLRFKELKGGILYAGITPKNNVIAFLADHFADRYPNEDFVIYDQKHNTYIMHEKYKQWFLVTGQKFDIKQLVYSTEEEKYQRLFTYFCHKIAITERTNKDLQRNMLPLRFRGDMVEF